jgi:hypothetical protein
MTTSDERIQEMTTQQTEKLLHRFADAQQRSDVAELDSLLTGDFKLVGPLGFVVPKQQWLEQFRSGALQITSLARRRQVARGGSALQRDRGRRSPRLY